MITADDVSSYFSDVESVSEQSLSGLNDIFSPDMDINQPVTSIEMHPPAQLLQLPVSPLEQNFSLDDPFSGKFQFELVLESQLNFTKSPSWTYSQKCRKLYIKAMEDCPIRFKTTFAPPAGARLYCAAIFTELQHRSDTVRRCPNHAAQDERNGHDAPLHFVRCADIGSVYWQCPATGRLIVSCLYHHSVDGCVTVNYQVMHTLAFFKVVNIKVCACPGRDRRLDERDVTSPFLGRCDKQLRVKHDMSSVDVKEEEADDDDSDKVYMLPVKGRKRYEMLKTINEAFEVSTIIANGKKNTSNGSNVPVMSTINIGKQEKKKERKREHIGSTPLVPYGKTLAKKPTIISPVVSVAKIPPSGKKIFKNIRGRETDLTKAVSFG